MADGSIAVPDGAPGDPPPVTTAARWPAHRRLVTDLALGGGALGMVIGAVLLGRQGWVGLIVGSLLGVAVGLVTGPRRLHLTVDERGVRIGRILDTVHVPWEDIAAFGIQDGWQGRRGRTAALAVGRRGDEWPITVPALSYTAAGFRVGATPPEEQLAPYRAELLHPVVDWARARRVTVVEADLDDWWDRSRRTTRA